ncbi:MAG: YraN family protein [Phycisphaerales bacterium]
MGDRMRSVLSKFGVGSRNDSVWKRGEKAAERVMRRAGCRVIERNLRIPPGEIDLLCRERRSGQFVLVEVKARMADGSSRRPEDSITAAKKRKLLLLAKALMRDEEVRGSGIRIDVVAVEFVSGQWRPAATRHYERAISSD